MIAKTLHTLAATLLWLVPSAVAQTPAELRERAAALESACAGFVDDADFPGCSIGVMQGGELVFAAGFGLANVEHEVPATADTIYRIGSITKQFTAALVLRAEERELLSLQDPVARWVPELDTRGTDPTLVQLLHHTSGAPNFTALVAWSKNARNDIEPAQVFEYLQGEDWRFDPGHDYEYSNTGYIALGLAVEAATDKSYRRLLQRELFGPLELDDTRLDNPRTIVAGRASGYQRLIGLVHAAPLGSGQAWSAGAISSNVGDLLRWQDALAKDRVLKPGGYARMKTSAQLIDGSATHYGFGLVAARFEDREWIRHAGGINGFASELSYFPELDLGICVLTNLDGGSAVLVGRRVANELLDIVYTDLPLEADHAARLTGRFEATGLRVDLASADDGPHLELDGHDQGRLMHQGGDVYRPASNNALIARVEFDAEGRAIAVELSGSRLPARLERSAEPAGVESSD
jgi:CubicO group peptidase (beta-lactamase class C family)